MTVITLLSDFGLTDPYVAQIKAVILRHCPGAEIVDISHGIERHNIAMGSFILETTAPFFSDGTVHVAIVDPGVGSNRRALVVVCNMAVLIGPDNGLLERASVKLGFEVAYEIREKLFMMERVSPTFHGRDIFALTAGKIAAGHKPSDVGPRVSRLAKLVVPRITVSKGRVVCNVLHIDRFGNVILDADEGAFRRSGLRVADYVRIRTAGREHDSVFARAYSDVGQDRLAVLWGSQGYLEIAVREDSAAERLGVKPSDRLELLFR